MIKVINKRQGGSMFHYAHFLCDCLFPEIVNEIQNYKVVIREKHIEQTIGNFSNIYSDVMMVKNTELLKEQFNKLNIRTLCYQPKEKYIERKYFDIFRNFIFSRYKINYLEYDTNYPEVILIKRNGRVNLINDEYLKRINTNVSTGKERREINNIDKLEVYLENKFNDKFKGLYFEDMPFQEQVKYFNNAKIIICAHGAVMSNMFFCKEGATIIEVVCNKNWPFFDKITQVLKLNHIKCIKNELNEVINCINTNS